MNILISNEQSKIKFTENYEKLIKKAIEYVITDMAFDIDFEVSVIITDKEGIHSLNLTHRGIDSSTDVLSFPMLEYEKEGVPIDNIQENEICLLGDIVISLETANNQANDFLHSTEREIAFLTVHSMLHLFGYDHEEKEDRVIMREKEECILEKMELIR